MPVEAALGDAEPARQGFHRHRGHALFGDLVERGLRPVVGTQARVAFNSGGVVHCGSLPYASVCNST